MNLFKIRIVFILIVVLSIVTPIILLLFRWHLFPIEIGYSNLEKLLYNQQWKEADRETSIIYQQIVSNHLREKGLYGLIKLDFLGQEEAVLFMGDLPFQKLKTLDELWLKYSKGQFGFSVQASIFNSIPSNNRKFINIDRADRYKVFKNKVGWIDKYWLDSESDYYMTNSEKFKGSLPSPLWMSLSPKPIDIAEPLEKFNSCINNKFDE